MNILGLIRFLLAGPFRDERLNWVIASAEAEWTGRLTHR